MNIAGRHSNSRERGCQISSRSRGAGSRCRSMIWREGPRGRREPTLCPEESLRGVAPPTPGCVCVCLPVGPGFLLLTPASAPSLRPLSSPPSTLDPRSPARGPSHHPTHRLSCRGYFALLSPAPNIRKSLPKGE